MATKVKEVKATKLYKVINADETRYLPNPLKVDQIVEQVEDESVPEGFIKVKHSGVISTFYRNRFKRIIVK